MAAKQITDGVYQVGSGTILLDGVWQSDTGEYLVSGQNKLSSIPDAQPGDIAYTAGCVHMWHLDTDGTTWVEF